MLLNLLCFPVLIPQVMYLFCGVNEGFTQIKKLEDSQRHADSRARFLGPNPSST